MTVLVVVPDAESELLFVLVEERVLEALAVEVVQTDSKLPGGGRAAPCPSGLGGEVATVVDFFTKVSVESPERFAGRTKRPPSPFIAFGMFQPIDYFESLYAPLVLLPGMPTKAETDADGWFSLASLPADSIVQLEVAHPRTRTTSVRAAVRTMEPAFRKPSRAQGSPTLSLLGSGFSYELSEGVTIRGQVRNGAFLGDHSPIPGITVGLANHNSPTGMSGAQVRTDAEGRFEITGLYPLSRGRGYDVAVVGSFEAPCTSDRFTVHPGEDAILEVAKAVPYRLTLTDSNGSPVDRTVGSIVVQSFPGTVRKDVKSRFNEAERVGPGIYQGIVPTGPGAVVVKRHRGDRPAMVDPKAFFAPGRADWTLEEARYCFGDRWRVARTAVSTNSILSVGSNPTIMQVDHAAIVLTNSDASSSPLELTATVHIDEPVSFSLVDQTGEPVSGASLSREADQYDVKELPSTFELSGLHPERPEYLQFKHAERGLIGYRNAMWTDEPVRVVMYREAKLIGSLVDGEGVPTSDFGIRFQGAVPPDTFVGNIVRTKDLAKRGRFELSVVPGVELTADLVRRTGDWRTRPPVGRAFDPVTPKPGETIDLGNLDTSQLIQLEPTQ